MTHGKHVIELMGELRIPNEDVRSFVTGLQTDNNSLYETICKNLTSEEYGKYIYIPAGSYLDEGVFNTMPPAERADFIENSEVFNSKYGLPRWQWIRTLRGDHLTHTVCYYC